MSARPRLVDPDPDYLFGRDPEEREETPDAAPSGFVAHNAVTIAAPLGPVPYICKDLGFARSSAPNCIAGYGYSRKTLALQDAALSVATGTPIWGRFECESTPVLHIDYEQGDYLTHLRYQRLAHARGIDLAALGDRLRFAAAPSMYLDSDGVEDALVALIQESAAGFVFVDSLKAATPTLEENSSAIRIPIDRLMRVSVRTGACITFVHHAKKPKSDDPSGSKFILRGSGAIFDACASVLTFTADEGQPTEVLHAKNRWTGRSIEPFALDSEDTDGDRGLRVFASTASGATLLPLWMPPLKAKIVEVVARSPGIKKSDLMGRVGGNAVRKAQAFDDLQNDGTIRWSRTNGVQLCADELH